MGMMTENSADTLQKYDLEVERTFLGSLLINPALAVPLVLETPSNVLYGLTHQRLFDVIKELWNEGLDIDVMTVIERASRHAYLDVTPALVTGLLTIVPSSMNILSYLEILYTLYKKRQLMETVTETISTMNTWRNQSDVDTVIYRMIDGLQGIQTGQQAINTAEAGAMAVLSKATYYATNQIAPGQVRGINTGWGPLNTFTSGLLGGYVYYVLGVEHSGKTWVLLNMLNRACQMTYTDGVWKPGAKALMFSLEMDAKVDADPQRSTLWDRLICMRAGIDITTFRSGNYTNQQIQNIERAADEVSTWDLTIYDNVFDYTGIAATCQRKKVQTGLDVVFIDYLGLIEDNTKDGDRRGSENRNLQLGNLTRSLKRLAGNLNVPVVIPHQVSSKAISDRTNHMPQPQDGYATGHLGQDADLIMTIYVPAMYKQDTQPENDARGTPGKVMYYKVAKNRITGSMGSGALWFEDNGRLTDYIDPRYVASSR